MASSRDNPLARWRLDLELPHHVIIWWGNYQSGESACTSRERSDVLTSALALDQTSKSYFASIEWVQYLVFCFSSREAAQQFRDRWNGQFIETDEVDRKGTWKPKEGDVCNLYRMDAKDWVNKWAQDAEPDQMGPIVRNTADGRKQLAHARWGVPSPPKVIEEAVEKRADKLR